MPDFKFLFSRQWVPDVWLERQIQHETEVIPHGHMPCFAADLVRESNAKDPLLEREAGDHERSHFPARQVQRQLLHPPGREFLQSVGDQSGAAGEELAGLRYHPLARGWRLEQFSGCRKNGRREFLFETAGEQPFQDVLGETQVSDLFLPHDSDLMFGRRTRHLTTANPTGLSVSDRASAGNEPVSIANLFGDDFAPPSAWHSTCANVVPRRHDVCF
jgi:hypothetical protein